MKHCHLYTNNTIIVIAGLDPAIQSGGRMNFQPLDHRVRPGDDEAVGLNQ